MHYFKRNIGDYHKKAGRLNMLQHGAYTLLIDACYDRERFPTRDEAVDWCWATNQDEIAAVDFVLSKFFDLVDGVYTQSRIVAEITQYHENAATNARIAQEREAKKRDLKARSVNEPSTVKHEPPPNQEPITTNQEPITSLVVQTTNAPAKAVAKQSTNGTRLPDEWQLPKALGEWAVEQGLNRDSVIAESERFRDYWIAQPGAKGRKTDWPATWRNWIRNRKPDSSKSFAEQSQDFKDAQAKKHYRTLSTMTDEERKAWGFDK